jgi:hypothetical protein
MLLGVMQPRTQHPLWPMLVSPYDMT